MTNKVLSIHNNRFHLIDHVSSSVKYFFFIVMFSHFIEKLDNVSEIHVPKEKRDSQNCVYQQYQPINDDISICLHQAEGYEQVKLWRGDGS